MTQIQPDGYLALPKNGQGAGILVLHAWWGLVGFFQDLCKRLARDGFVTFAPDLYHGYVAATLQDAKRLRSKLNKRQVETDAGCLPVSFRRDRRMGGSFRRQEIGQSPACRRPPGDVSHLYRHRPLVL